MDGLKSVGLAYLSRTGCLGMEIRK